MLKFLFQMLVSLIVGAGGLALTMWGLYYICNYVIQETQIPTRQLRSNKRKRSYHDAQQSKKVVSLHKTSQNLHAHKGQADRYQSKAE